MGQIYFDDARLVTTEVLAKAAEIDSYASKKQRFRSFLEKAI